MEEKKRYQIPGYNSTDEIITQLRFSGDTAMWKKINPNMEYVIAAMRKQREGEKLELQENRRPEEGKPAAEESSHSCS